MRSFSQLGQAKVQKLDTSTLGDKHVAGFDVAMNNPFGVGRLQSFSDLYPELQELVCWKRLVLNPVQEGLSLQKLHHNKGLTLVISDVVNDADIGVIECRGRPSLSLEPLQCLAILGKLLRQELQSHIAA